MTSYLPLDNRFSSLVQRVVSFNSGFSFLSEGKTLAQNYASKYIEVSAILNHKIDDLLVGILKQIRSNDSRLSSGNAAAWWNPHHHQSRHGAKDSIRSDHSAAAAAAAQLQGSVGSGSPSADHQPAADNVSLCSSTAGEGNGASCPPLTVGCLSKYGGMLARLRRVGSPRGARRREEQRRSKSTPSKSSSSGISQLGV
jgi:hypothetical protein